MMGRSLRAHFNANYFRYTSGDSNIFKALNQNLFIKTGDQNEYKCYICLYIWQMQN